MKTILSTESSLIILKDIMKYDEHIQQNTNIYMHE